MEEDAEEDFGHDSGDEELFGRHDVGAHLQDQAPGDGATDAAVRHHRLIHPVDLLLSEAVENRCQQENADNSVNKAEKNCEAHKVPVPAVVF